MTISQRDSTQVRDRLASGAALIWAVTLFQRVVQMATVLILARLLTPQDYGVVSVAVVFTTFLDVVTNVQIGSAVQRLDDLEPAHLDTAFTLNLLRAAASSALTALMARPIAVLMHDPRLQDAFYILTIPPLLAGLQNPYFSLFSRNLDFRQQSLREALASLLGVIASITVAFIYHSYWALIVNGGVVAMVRTVVSYWRAPGIPGISLSKSRDLLVFGSWIMLVSVADYISTRVDFLLIGNRLGSAAVGAYNIANTLTTQLTFDVAGALTQTLLPAFSTISTDAERLRRGYKEAQTVTMALALPIGFGISAIAPDLVLLLVGAKWTLAIPVIRIQAPITALQMTAAGVEAMAYTLNKGRAICIRSWLFLAMRVAFMIAGFMLGGFLGIIWSRALCVLIQTAYNLYFAQKMVGLPMSTPLAGWRSLASAMAMWLVVKYLPLPTANAGQYLQLVVNLAAQISVGGVIYIGLHGLLWALCGLPPGAEQRLVGQARRFTARWFPLPQTPAS